MASARNLSVLTFLPNIITVMDSNEIYQKEVEDYLQEKGVYDELEDLMRSLLKDLPSDPVSYLLSKLKPQPNT